METVSDTQSKSFLLVKTFLDSTLTVTAHKLLNSCRGVISEPDLLCTTEAEILEGLSDEGVTQPLVPLPESVTTTAISEPCNTSKNPKRLKQNSKNRRKRAKEQKPEVEIEMSHQMPKKISYEDEDMIIYVVDEEEQAEVYTRGCLSPTRYRK
ncbi:hypothetical protein TNCV_45691 [Trichonephila clavipes]|nr:hypothetical protein TNCV_45691 [Trichonephila clavipes]